MRHRAGRSTGPGEPNDVGRDRGEAVLEHVVLVPIALFVVLLGVQTAVYFHAANLAELAASRAIAAATRHGSSNATGEQEASSVVVGSGGTLVSASVTGSTLLEAKVVVAVPRVLPLFTASVTRWRRGSEERYIPEDQR